MTLFRVLYTVVHEFSVLSLEAINIARSQEAASNQLQDIRGIQTTTVNTLRQDPHTRQHQKIKGVEIVETFMTLKLVDYPADVTAIESLAVCGRLVYFASAKGPRTVGGGGRVDVLLHNETNSCSEIKRVASFKNILAFTDSGAYQVKASDPVDKVVL